MTIDEVRQMVDLARSQGLRRLKVDGLELEFAPEARPAEPGKAVRGRPMPTAQDFLFWSTDEPLSVDPRVVTEAQKAAMPDAAPGKPS